MKIAVAGATGRVGAPLARTLTARGHDVVPISRSAGADVVTGAGLEQALDGVQCVVDTTAGTSKDGDDLDYRRRQVHGGLHGGEGRARASDGGWPVPVGILRAAQFHEFVEPMMNWGDRGARPELLADAAALLADREGDPVKIEVAGDSDDPDRDLYAGGALLPGPAARLAGPTFAEWLSQRNGGRG